MMSTFSAWRETLLDLSGKSSTSGKLEKGFLCLILAACAMIRIWTMSTPSLDRTMWKEIDYIEISRNYWQHGFHFFQPEITWPAAPPRVTAMELPLVPYASACLYQMFGYSPYTVRAIPLICWLLVGLYTYRLTRRELGPVVGLASATAACVIPILHDFGKALFSEPAVVALSVASLFYYAEWNESRRRGDWIKALACFTLAVALKLEPLFLLLPLLWAGVLRPGQGSHRRRDFVVFTASALALPLAWYGYAFYLSRTSIDVFGVVPFLQGHDKLQTVRMLTDPEWYRTISHRLIGLVSWKPGAALLVVGVLSAMLCRIGGLFFAYLAAVLIYLGLVAEGNIDAPYRQLNLVPVFSVFLAVGLIATLSIPLAVLKRLRPIGDSNRLAGIVAALACVLLPLVLVRQPSKVLRGDPESAADASRWELGQYIKANLGGSCKLVTLGEYSIHKGGNDLSPVLYYYSGVQGWSLQEGEWDLRRVEELASSGATHLAAVEVGREPGAVEFLSKLKGRYRLISEGSDWTLLELQPAHGNTSITGIEERSR